MPPRRTIFPSKIDDLQVQFIHKYVWESPREKELVFSFITVTEKVPVVNRDEIDEGRFWGVDEIAGSIGKEVFTPNFEHEFVLLKQKLIPAESAENLRRGR